MCYVIVTSRSLLWLLLSIVTGMCILSALVTPKWLIGLPKSKIVTNETFAYTPSVGIYNRCTLIDNKNLCGPFALEGFATDNKVFPAPWKATFFFMSLGLAIMTLTVAGCLISCCVQSVFKKSIFSLTGTIQVFAGVCLVIGMVLYPFGWGSPIVQRICGIDATPFIPSECSLGWALYCGIVGTILPFICGGFSLIVEKSTSIERIEPHIQEGQTLICLS